MTDYRYTQNRDLSWLRFNERVLQEARDTSVPLLERLRFVTIFSSNLDEFFMIRMGSTYDLGLHQPEHIDNKSGLKPMEIFNLVLQRVHPLLQQMDEIFHEVEYSLEQYECKRLTFRNWTDLDRKYARHFFRQNVLPVLSPQILDSRHPFPHVPNKVLHLCVELREVDKSKKKGATVFGMIPVPEFLPRMILLPGPTLRYLLLEEIILEYATEAFPFYEILDKSIFCLTRNADLSIDELELNPLEDYKEQMRTILKRRSRLAPIRLEVQYRTNANNIVRYLMKQWNLKDQQVYYQQAPLTFNYLAQLMEKVPVKHKVRFLYPAYTPQYPTDWNPQESKIRQVMAADRLLYFPYDSLEPFLQLIKEASEDSTVLSIKIAIYRLANRSRLVEYLLSAVEHGKEVLVLVELRARFDEANNINWTEILEDGGCKVIYGLENFKAHAKLCLITRQERDKIQYITQIGTGNYNEKTVHLYTDLSLFTADQTIGEDTNRFFANMNIGNLEGQYEALLVAPHKMKSTLLTLIEQEIQKVRQGKYGFIGIKANSLSERDLLDKLSEASQAGVKIQLMIRGICCLLPGIPRFTENIEIRSIVGRFLEHPRIYIFGTGDTREILIGSADGMTRNLNYRVEILCPVKSRNLQQQILHYWDVMWQDNRKVRFMQQDGSLLPYTNSLAEPINAQEVFMEEAQKRSTPSFSKGEGLLRSVRKIIRTNTWK